MIGLLQDALLARRDAVQNQVDVLRGTDDIDLSTHDLLLQLSDFQQKILEDASILEDKLREIQEDLIDSSEILSGDVYRAEEELASGRGALIEAKRMILLLEGALTNVSSICLSASLY